MTDIKDGGPAFPVEVDSAQPDGRQTGNTVWQAYGLSMRDYFAKGAMEAECIHQGLEGRDVEHIAGMAYEMADAMIRAREARHD